MTRLEKRTEEFDSINNFSIDFVKKSKNIIKDKINPEEAKATISVIEDCIQKVKKLERCEFVKIEKMFSCDFDLQIKVGSRNCGIIEFDFARELKKEMAKKIPLTTTEPKSEEEFFKLQIVALENMEVEERFELFYETTSDLIKGLKSVVDYWNEEVVM